MIEVLVTCFPHEGELARFPQVRGHYLAKHLARAGVRAEFRQLPLPGFECEALICSDFQARKDYFEARLAPLLDATRSQSMFCLADSSLASRPDHFSRQHCQWFGERGGVLCHLEAERLMPYEHWIGLGVDDQVVRPVEGRRRDRVVFDMPDATMDDGLDVDVLSDLRRLLPGLRIVGTGSPDDARRHAFDEWVPYGQRHPAYVAAAFSGCLAFVPGWGEALGLTLAEAQVAGCCIVSSPWQVKDQMLVPEAAVGYVVGDVHSLANALAEARRRDPGLIRERARARFDFDAVVERTRRALGLTRTA